MQSPVTKFLNIVKVSFNILLKDVDAASKSNCPN